MSTLIEFRIGYFLVGAFLFMSMRLIEKLKWFGGNSLPRKDPLMIIYLMVGTAFVYILIAQIIYFTSLEPYQYGIILNQILGVILLSISAILFISNSFIYPSKNFLISIIVGGIISIILTITFVNYVPIVIIEGYSILIWGFIAHIIGLVVGSMIYIILYYKYKEGLKELWKAEKYWKIINSYYLLIPLFIIIIIEMVLSFRLLSILTIFL